MIKTDLLGFDITMYSGLCEHHVQPSASGLNCLLPRALVHFDTNPLPKQWQTNFCTPFADSPLLDYADHLLPLEQPPYVLKQFKCSLLFIDFCIYIFYDFYLISFFCLKTKRFETYLWKVKFQEHFPKYKI